MKKRLLALLFCVVASMSVKVLAQEIHSLNSLQETLNDVLGKTASSNSFAMSGAKDVSTPFIGYIPHFSVELAAGASVLGLPDLINFANGTYSLTSNLDKLPGVGAAAPLLTLRIGGVRIKKFNLNVPIDFGFNIGGIPTTDIAMLEGSKLQFGTFMIGFEARTPIFQEQRLAPGLAFVLAYGYNGMALNYEVPFSSLLPAEGLATTSYMIKINDGPVDMDLNSHTISTRLHGHKTLLFFEPYIGIEPAITFSSSSLKVSLNDISIEGRGAFAGVGYSVSDVLDSLSDEVKELVGTEKLTLTEEGLMLNNSDTFFSSRLYGGFGLRMWGFSTNFGVGYDPFKSVLTGSVNLRFTY